jgi:3-isopropylmalate/(R)-2-methylmalate dehydratase small subunit
VSAEQGYELTIDLAEQQVRTPDGQAFGFEIDAFRKSCLLEGLDDIGLTLKEADAIKQFEQQAAQRSPWLFNDR